ncbi:hypothetical protein D7V97_12475 [Corallococcus sp. CA053C]|uniref:hypothetical protein n=1 Tax=Corallococcus sp. CA053C TaxID=2316732 RepID=UPI000EA14475|nr:hypothetical protein [Corallococcus sp. CA053C]RKH10944.1 hypothetical protein D7V97_12475 [Corallococcus sp. CA053C]
MNIILQAWYASGDRYAVAAALILDSKKKVCLICDGEDPEAETEVRNISAFYRASGISRDRIVFADVRHPSNDWAGGDVEALYRAAKDSQQGLHVGYSNSIVSNAFKVNATLATQMLQTHWIGTPQKSLDEAFSKLVEQLASQLNESHRPLAGGKLALLWVRFSGKKDKSHPAHPELDTSISGLSQIARMLKERGIPYAFIGDKFYSRSSGARKHESFMWPPFSTGLNLIEFWKHKALASDDDGQGRIAQLRFIDFLARTYRTVSIGMRSGVLEGPAYLGVPTIFIEDEGNPQAERWEKMLGVVPGFERLTVTMLPSATGVRFRVVEELFELIRKCRPLVRYSQSVSDLGRPEKIALFENFVRKTDPTDESSYGRFSTLYLYLLQDVLLQWFLFAEDGTRLVRPAARALQNEEGRKFVQKQERASNARKQKPVFMSTSMEQHDSSKVTVSRQSSKPVTVLLDEDAPPPDLVATLNAWSEDPSFGEQVETLVKLWFQLLLDPEAKENVRGFFPKELETLGELVEKATS